MTNSGFKLVMGITFFSGLIIGTLEAIRVHFFLVAPAIWILSLFVGFGLSYVLNFLEHCAGNMQIGRRTKPLCPECIRSGLTYSLACEHSFVEEWGADPANKPNDYNKYYLGSTRCSCSNGHEFTYDIASQRSKATSL